MLYYVHIAVNNAIDAKMEEALFACHDNKNYSSSCVSSILSHHED